MVVDMLILISSSEHTDNLLCMWKIGHKAFECRPKPLMGQQAKPFVKGQWPPTRSAATSNSKPNPLPTNMIVQSDENESDATDNGMVVAGNGDISQAGILAVQGAIAETPIEDQILDTGSAVYLISSKLYNTISPKHELQPIKGNYIVANGSLLDIKG